MSLDSVLQSVSDSPIGMTIAQNASLFPTLESIHVLAMATVVGTIAIVDLRLLGHPAHRRGARQLIRDLLPYTWIAFGIAVIAGSLLFSSNAVRYAHNSQFQSKLALIGAAGINMAVFHLTAFRRIVDWDELLPPPLAARIAGAISLTLWIGVIFLGRWVGFTL